MRNKMVFTRESLYRLVDTSNSNPSIVERVYYYVQFVAIIFSIMPLAFRGDITASYLQMIGKMKNKNNDIERTKE